MGEEKRININEMPRWFKLMMVLVPLVGFIVIKYRLDNDFYFIYPTGEYIVNNGFPVKDFLSMHGDMTIIVQQWLATVIYYFAYKALGTLGPMLIVYGCYVAFVFLMYRLCLTASGNHFIASVCALFADFYIAMAFSATRPQVMTYVVMAAELLALEKFVKTKKATHLIVIPVLSLLLINLHSSMWAMIFIFMLPYFAGAVKLNIPKLKLKQEPCCSFLYLFVTAAVSFAVGFINPYGFKAMTYILTSFGYDEISDNIIEMIPPSFANNNGKLLIVYLVLIAGVALFYKSKKLTTRFVLLFAGTLALSLMAQKSIPYFLIGGFAALSYMLSDVSFSLPVSDEVTDKDKKKRVILIILIIIALIAAVVAYIVTDKNDQNVDDEKTSAAQESTYEQLDEAIALIRQSDEEIVLYGGFNIGQYLEFNGLHPYIDGRAELFLKDNNGEYDYLQEYIDFRKGVINYREFIDKYGFNYLVVEDTNHFIVERLDEDEDFTELYKGEKIHLYKRVG